jgi:hypothetical protein
VIVRGSQHFHRAFLFAALMAGCGGSDDNPVPEPPDTTPPVRVADLHIAARSDSSLLLKWTSPRDGPRSAVGWSVRYSDVLLTDANWDAAIELAISTRPAAAGLDDSVDVRIATPAQNGFIALRTADAAANISALSNIVETNPDIHWDSEFGDGGFDGPVYALAVFEGDIIAGGDFTFGGGNAVSNIARWTGTTWEGLGEGIDSAVLAAIEYGGALVAVTAERVVRWDGAAWSEIANRTIPAPLRDDVSILVHEGDLVVAAGEVHTWDGVAWTRIYPSLGATALTVFNGQLYLGNSAGDVLRWAGTGWATVHRMSGADPAVLAFAVYNEKLVAAGAFEQVAFSLEEGAVVSWDGFDWYAIGGLGVDAVPAEVVSSLAVCDERLIAGGSAFLHDLGAPQPARGLAAWDGDFWRPLGSGVRDGPTADSRVDALLCVDGAVIVGGCFKFAGQAAAFGIARWSW